MCFFIYNINFFLIVICNPSSRTKFMKAIKMVNRILMIIKKFQKPCERVLNRLRVVLVWSTKIQRLWFIEQSCFLNIFVSTTAIIYSKLFSLTLRQFFLLMWSLDDAIWKNVSSFLKTLGKLFLDFW